MSIKAALLFLEIDMEHAARRNSIHIRKNDVLL